MGLFNLFNRFTRSFRKKKKRKTRRSKVGGQDKYSDLARDAMRRATGPEKIKAIKNEIEANKKRQRRSKQRFVIEQPRPRSLEGRPPKLFVAKTHHTPPEKLMKEKTRSGRTSPPPQYPGKGPGIMGVGRKTRRRKGKGYSKIHKEMFKKKYCQSRGGRWENGICKLNNPQAGQPGGGRRRRTRRRKKDR